MSTLALALALSAACLHALWNLLLAHAPDVEAATAVALVTAEVVFLPVAIVMWHVDAAVWPWAVASGALELAYFALLAAAYRRAPLSVVYPVARGGAPVLVLLVGAVALGHATSWPQAGGGALVVVGVILVRGLPRPAGRGVGFGLVIAVCIASYTLVDKRGVEHAGTLAYLEITMVAPTILYAAAVLHRRGGAAVRAAVVPATVVAGLGTFVAY